MIKPIKNFPFDRSRLQRLLKSYGVKRAGLFGSFARGEETSKSDVDILVKLPAGKSLLDLISLKMDIKDLLKKNVDLLTYDSVHPRLKKQIFSEEISIL